MDGCIDKVTEIYPLLSRRYEKQQQPNRNSSLMKMLLKVTVQHIFATFSTGGLECLKEATQPCAHLAPHNHVPHSTQPCTWLHTAMCSPGSTQPCTWLHTTMYLAPHSHVFTWLHIAPHSHAPGSTHPRVHLASHSCVLTWLHTAVYSPGSTFLGR